MYTILPSIRTAIDERIGRRPHTLESPVIDHENEKQRAVRSESPGLKGESSEIPAYVGENTIQEGKTSPRCPA
jgi:hypothetical protein